MTKRELLKEYEKLAEEKGVFFDGINQNCNKSMIQNAINCLKCSDEILDRYFIVFSLKYPNTAATIEKVGDFKKHRFNRSYVYNTVRSILAD